MSIVARRTVLGVSLGTCALAATLGAQQPEPFTIAQIRSYPFPSELVTSAAGARMAWVFNERGARNVWFAEAPDFAARELTPYRDDDGQELTNLSITPDGRAVVFVRGGDHDGNWQAEGGLAPDPASSPTQPKVDIWEVATSGCASTGCAPKMLAEGDEPVMSPKGDRVAFLRDRQIWIVPVDGSQPAKRLFFDRGTDNSPTWSPDGSRLAFVSNRGDHSFIGIYTSDTQPIEWLAPTTSHDGSPRWSPDGNRIAFVRLPGSGGAPQTVLELHPRPFTLMVADVSTGVAHVVWKSPATLAGSFPTSQGEVNLHWATGDRLVFLADLDGWAHLYSIASNGGTPQLLTPGHFMVEYVDLSPDGARLVYNANTGASPSDIDRRHLFVVPVDRAAPVALTPGDGIEWIPTFTGDGQHIAFIGGGAQRSPLPMVIASSGGAPKVIGAERVPAEFPASKLVTPRMVTFKAADGVEVHGQLFEAAGGAAKKPALVFVHGGPPRQMLLGWHYMDYYSNGYAMNQYMASRGYVVLSVNYRLGIGYGRAFHHPEHAGPRGASEYLDVKAGGEFLRALPEVDAKRIGIWGGSYGGFLTALALARNSDLFAAGVDLHGVHDWIADRPLTPLYEKSDFDRAQAVAWRSSPVSSIATWRSPVLLIQGDDDRNVRFHQTVDLARRLDAANVPYEELVLPDEIHGFLRDHSWLVADAATARFFDRQFRVESKAQSSDSRCAPQRARCADGH